MVIDDADSRIVGKPEVTQRRGGTKPISTLGATLRLVEKHIRRHLVCPDQISNNTSAFVRTLDEDLRNQDLTNSSDFHFDVLL